MLDETGSPHNYSEGEVAALWATEFSCREVVAAADRLVRGFLAVCDSLKDPTFSLSEGLLGIIIPLLEGAEWIAGVHAAAKFGVPLAEKWSAALEPIHECARRGEDADWRDGY